MNLLYEHFRGLFMITYILYISRYIILYSNVLYSSIYISPLNSRGPTEALLVRLAPRKETSFKK